MNLPIICQKSNLLSLYLASTFTVLSACSAPESLNQTEASAIQLQDEESVYEVLDPERLNVLQPASVALQNGIPYPTRTDYQIKAIQPDYWNNKQDFIDANTGGIAVNLVWNKWEPKLKTSTCNAQSEVRFDGHCFTIDKSIEEQIRYWSNKDVVVTAIVYGVPGWAQIKQGCNPTNAARKPFCAPQNSSDYARFAGFVAERFDGRHGKGRVADFVIHNEVNMNNWYNVGCGSGVACDQSTWISRYANDYNAAYDAISARQPAAKVFTSFAHQFDESLNDPAAEKPLLSVKTFIRAFATLTGSRKWRVAYHPYPPSLLHPVFGAEDLPLVTYGNIGVLAGWLRSEFPFQPEAWEIHLTESGVNSVWLYSSEAEQAAAICDSFRNILGTPGIENHIYHRMVDHSDEVKQGAGFGLHNDDRTPKQAWGLWSTMSGRNGQHENLNCGFENVPYTKLSFYVSDERHPWASTRIPPKGYEKLASWKLLRSYEENTSMLFECGVADGSYISSDVSCGGALTLGPVGYAYATPVENSTGLFSCQKNSVNYLSTSDACDGGQMTEFLGYAIN